MKVKLPSNGLLGTKWVDLEQPTIESMRKTITATNDEYLFKYEFVKGLSEFDDKTITMDDIQYLFDIAASVVSFNILDFRAKCGECDEMIDSQLSFLDDEIPVHTLHKDSRKCKKEIDGVEYEFHILSAADGVDIHTYALDDTESEKMIEDATVCKVLGYDITDENIEKVKSIPMSIYVACFLFVKANKHGMEIVKKVKCPKCGKESYVRINLDSSFVRIDLPTFIAQYAQVRDCLDFKSFLKFNLPEYNNFVEYLNAEAKKNNNEW